MNDARNSRWSGQLVLGLVAAAAVVLVLSGCGGKKADTSLIESGTAKAGLGLARSALSTMAPDAKLLVVQTAQSVTPTASPIWVYLFGSPKSNKTYVVYVRDGKVMGNEEYGKAGLSKKQWTEVPSADGWVVDDDEAYTKALEASGAKGDPAGHYMGWQTYVPSSTVEGAPAKAFTWYVYLDPGESGATTSAIEVNVKTGATTVGK